MTSVRLSQVAIQLRSQDNVAVAARALQAGLEIHVDDKVIKLGSRVGLGHKFALGDIKKGEAIRKYGQIIGFASQDIPTGAHVHVHNVAADVFERDYAFCRELPAAGRRNRRTRHFQGYDRGRSAAYGTAQLHRHHQHRQLLGQHQQVHLRTIPRAPTCSSSIRTSTAWWPSRTRPAAPCSTTGPTTTSSTAPGRLRQAPQRRRLHPGRPRLRDGPGHPPGRKPGSASSSIGSRMHNPTGADHSGVRRHRQDGRRRRPGHRRTAAARQRRAPRAACRRTSSSSAPTAAAPTATAA